MSISAPLIDEQCFDIINSIKYSTYSDLKFTTSDEYKKSNFAYYMYDNINKKYDYSTNNDNSNKHITLLVNRMNNGTPNMSNLILNWKKRKDFLKKRLEN